LACFAVSVRAAYNASTASTCNTLASVLPELVVFPEQDVYNSTITSYPFLQLRLHPTCIVRPNSAEDVAATLKVLRESDCTNFAIKGGGHNANAGFNNIDDGVTIDMQSMSKVELERGHEVARVGAGSVWQGVYDEVEKQNRTVLGGRIGVVGVAGFTTGGRVAGFFYFEAVLTQLQVVCRSRRLSGAGAATRWLTTRSSLRAEKS
jgi:FAD/FMN-containing dehydrogenase